MLTRPEIRYLIPCWKEPTIAGRAPSANEIFTAIQLKEGFSYPAWQRPFFVLVMITNLHGVCDFRIELTLEELEQESLIATTEPLSLSLGNDPLRIQPVSIMMKAAKLPRPGVYHLALIWNDEVLANATIHAR